MVGPATLGGVAGLRFVVGVHIGTLPRSLRLIQGEGVGIAGQNGRALDR